MFYIFIKQEDTNASEEENPQKNYRSIWNTLTMKPFVNAPENSTAAK